MGRRFYWGGFMPYLSSRCRRSMVDLDCWKIERVMFAKGQSFRSRRVAKKRSHNGPAEVNFSQSRGA